MEGVKRREVRILSSMPLFHFQVNTNINLYLYTNVSMTQELKGKCEILGLSSNVIVNIHNLNKYQILTMEIKWLFILLKVLVRNLGIISLRRILFFL